jgi:predicted DNA-binding protein (MmcQ/YjbR family)
MNSKELFRYVKEKYGTDPEYFPHNCPRYFVLRHDDNRKCYAAVMTADVSSTGTGSAAAESGLGEELLLVKIPDDLLHSALLAAKGYLPAFAMDRQHWISCRLRDLPDAEIEERLRESFLAAASRETRQRMRGPKAWLIPANSHYYDPRHFFDSGNEIHWKQSVGTVKTGDTIFIYAGVPIGCILYRCSVGKTDIPVHREDRYHIRTEFEMVLYLNAVYPEGMFTRELLAEKYGVVNIRGLRGVPGTLLDDLLCLPQQDSPGI